MDQISKEKNFINVFLYYKKFVLLAILSRLYRRSEIIHGVDIICRFYPKLVKTSIIQNFQSLKFSSGGVAFQACFKSVLPSAFFTGMI